jgi:uncharacterized protein
MLQKSVRQIVIENFGSCNMRCTYCFPEHMWQREGRFNAMSEEMYKGILERVFPQISSSSTSVDIHLAGGEPLLAGQSWLEMAFRTAREIADRYNKQVTFSLQTNATLVTPELAQFLANNKATVGVSLDGSVEINELTRGKSDKTLRGFQLLREAIGRSPGVIVTVTKCNARRMHEVVDYLDSLGVALFRANQMGATASWNAHSAPDAEDWFIARRDIFKEIVARRGRIMEHNLAHAIPKFVRTLLNDVSPFNTGCGCWDMRCPAGQQLMYFDQKGSAYPCPRANVTADSSIGHYAAEDFELLWDERLQQLDAAMTTAPDCKQCPAQFVCDYGCYAFNVASGNFFEVNCDATKDYFQWISSHLKDVAQIFLYISWRKQLKEIDDYESVKNGIFSPLNSVSSLVETLNQKLVERLSRKDIVSQVLNQRYSHYYKELTTSFTISS